MKILVLDDDQDLLVSIKKILGALNHDVDCLSDADTAVAMIEQNEYDFALVDFKMPVHDGIWFMKNADIPRSTKVLLMTAYADRNIINKMFKLGVCGYIIKPLDDGEIKHHLEFHSRRHDFSQGSLAQINE